MGLNGNTLYDVLGIDIESSQAEIKSAYLKLAKETHPDAIGKTENHQFIRIKEAYEILSDPGMRRSYDWHVKQKLPERSPSETLKGFKQSVAEYQQSASAASCAPSSEYLQSLKFRQQLRSRFPKNEKERLQKVNARKVNVRASSPFRFFALPFVVASVWAYGGYQMA
mmetsp:Transcript_10049/g.11530  ORF Transcript_10049/g.11530 Transcript_10049/m.11530 type:complete len:168 (+) Transcript_10049:319-822(+)|eukprot:CAMPEP_0184005574 /NCGR_PEP_ID=MMETSP0954-20121128/145_1 /TAXON_ID=627963 /ORGANISM="Aplanochytrium sp, Strain PBS07" /LENGTH=167 /DNA_ID=CAMNT_0026283891 /DNA_START=252 /DNA_END=755 /DNA_ORIENTATION=-